MEIDSKNNSARNKIYEILGKLFINMKMKTTFSWSQNISTLNHYTHFILYAKD